MGRGGSEEGGGGDLQSISSRSTSSLLVRQLLGDPLWGSGGEAERGERCEEVEEWSVTEEVVSVVRKRWCKEMVGGRQGQGPVRRRWRKERRSDRKHLCLPLPSSPAPSHTSGRQNDAPTRKRDTESEEHEGDGGTREITEES